MLRQIIEAWKAKDLLVQVYDSFNTMLKETEEMFAITHQVMFEGGDEKSLEEQLYKIDIHVNKAERKVRKQIVEHLAIRPDVDMPACLILMSVVKDAERLGDYCKNLVEAYQLVGSLQEGSPYRAEFDSLHKEIAAEFKATEAAIKEHSEEQAYKVIHQQVDLAKTSDELFKRLAEDKLETRQAVAYTLIARYYKRIACHLANIATSVVVPVHKIDYFYEKDEEGKKDYIK